jgi:hypothetical protein
MYGLHEPEGVGLYRGLDALKAFIAGGRKAQLGEAAGPSLAADSDALDAFRTAYSIPRFTAATFAPGQRVRAVIGLDGGSTSSKAVLVGEDGAVLCKAYQLSKGNPTADTKELLARLKAFVHDQGATLDVIGFGATGYAAAVLDESLRADVNVVETVAHMMAAVKYFGDVDVICDIGGQDIKVLFMANGELRNFRLSNQCSAGNGMLLQAMADQFGVPVTEYADTAFKAGLSPKFSYGCAVFLDADRVNFQKEGYSKELLAGSRWCCRRTSGNASCRPRMAALGRYVLRVALSKPRRRESAGHHIQRACPTPRFTCIHTREAGDRRRARNAQVVTRRELDVHRLDAAIDLARTSRNTNHAFSFPTTARYVHRRVTPDGRTSRYFGSVARHCRSQRPWKVLTARRLTCACIESRGL